MKADGVQRVPTTATGSPLHVMCPYLAVLGARLGSIAVRARTATCSTLTTMGVGAVAPIMSLLHSTGQHIATRLEPGVLLASFCRAWHSGVQ